MKTLLMLATLLYVNSISFAQPSLLFKIDLQGIVSLRASNDYRSDFDSAVRAAERGQYDLASSAFRRLLDKHPDNLVATQGWISSMVAAGRGSELERRFARRAGTQRDLFARAMFFRAKWILESKFDPWNRAGRNANEYDLSLNRLVAGLDANLTLVLARIERDLPSRTSDARLAIERYVRKFGTNDELEVYRGFLYATGSYYKSPKDDPVKPSPNLADNAKALRILDQVIKKRDDLPWADFYRGVVLHRLGRTSEAIASMKKFRESGPKDARRMIDAVAYIRNPTSLSLLTSMGPVKNLPPGYTGDPPRPQ